MRIFNCPLCLLFICLPANASQVARRVIAPGIELSQIVIAPSEPGGPELIHILSVDTTQRGVRLEAALGGGTVEEAGGGMEGVNRQVLRVGALGGINADFFPYTGDPLGLDIHNGELVSEPFTGRGAVGFSAHGRPIIGRPAFRGAVTTDDGATIPINGVNRKPAPGELILFAPVYGARTSDKPATVVTVRADGGPLKSGATVKASVLTLSDETTAVSLPPQGFVLSGTGGAAAWLKAHAAPGAKLSLRVEVSEPGRDWGIVREAVAGGPVLMLNGRDDLQLDTEKMGRDFSTTRHPRSAVGVTKDGKVLLVVVDGRQSLSRGMSLVELTKAMRDLGAVDALNLDGGGSTAMCIRGLVINCPSDGQVRRTANSLLVFDDAVKPVSPAALTAGEAAGIDLPSDGRPVALSVNAANGDLLWGTLNGGAFAAQAGGVYGYKPGAATVAAMRSDGTVAFARAVKVLPGPAGKMLMAWTDGTLRITVRDVNNNPVQGQEIMLTKSDGAKTEVTTGSDGRALVPKGWLQDERQAVTLTSGVLTGSWPESGAG